MRLSTFLAFHAPVKVRSPAKIAWLLCLCVLLASLTEARAQSYSLATDASADILTITFPKNAPRPEVVRTGAKRVEVLFPEGTKLKGVSGGTVRGRHIANLSVADNVLVVETEGDAFGFAAAPKGDKAIQVQLFYDPAGSNWKPSQGAPKAPPGQPSPVPPASGAGGQTNRQEPGAATPASATPTPAPATEVKGKIDFSGEQRPPASPARAQASPPQAAPPSAPPVAQQQNPAPQAKQAASGKVPSGPAGQPGAQQPKPSPPSSPATQSGPQAVPAPPAQAGQPEAAKAGSQPQTKGTSSPAPAEPAKPAGEVRGTVNRERTEASPAAQPAPQPAPAAGQDSAKSGPQAAPAAGKDGAKPAAQPQPGQPASPQSAGEPAKTPAQPAPQAGEKPKPPEAPASEPGKEPASSAQEPAKDESLDDKALLLSGQQAQGHGDYDKALQVAQTLLQKPQLSKDLREGALYLQAEAVFALNKDKLPQTYEETNDALQQALNFNTKSRNVPRALIKLGYINLRQGNLPEARAYFNLMRSKFPVDEEVPLIDVYWGEYYLDQAKLHDPKANFERASQSFKQVLQKYPESRFAREAALGLSRAELELGQFGDAAKIVDYIDKRWPRYYVENPTMLRVTADIAYKLGDFAKAKDNYLWFYNLVPNDSSNDLVLARLGDVSVKLGQMDSAREFYDMAIRLYPGKEGALMAMMRMAEEGIHDAPTLQEMYKAFADPKEIKPDKIYEIIINEYPKSALAPLAMLKLAMWRMYKEQYPETLDLVDRFTKTYPDDPLKGQAIEVGTQAFQKMIDPLLEQMDYKRIVGLWRTYPFLAPRMDLLPDHERLGVALALYYQGAPKEALAIVEPYLDKGPTPDAQKALALMLTIYRENQDWQSILDALRKVSSWPAMAENPRRALEFAQAMAWEHTGEREKSRLLWARLAADNQLDPAKRAYAVYYQALTAYERADYDKALLWAMDSRALFKEAAKDDGKARDALLLMIKANQAAGRYKEALALCSDYAKEAPENSAEWAANRLRTATLHRLMGDVDTWRKILTEMRDTMGDTLYGKMAASELATKGIEERAGRLTGQP